MKVFGSILSCDSLNLQKEIDRLIGMGVSALHLDVMDGVFVDKIFLGESVVNEITRRYKGITIECHLMVSTPAKTISHLDLDRIDRVIIHQADSLRDVLACVKASRCTVGLAIVNTDELHKINEIKDAMHDKIDKILVMGVLPGEGGQPMRSNTKYLLELAQKEHPDLIIGVDGGVNMHTLHEVQSANEAVLGSCLFNESAEETLAHITKHYGE
ncbi:ribulose-phosphate 3-epimerase [Nematocida parisii]|uniref:Ribulose-phosphate 3-epimerase n=1 Tax=Nematocida parisii (strain ERTm3) TaxID=935791 RepID=I3EKA4_NEMP3|nr:uncharacterized protein NEPG_00814 [Nematocida parisii ERTm1]EIJ89651.1 hypothetical protein NEQG_00421 [Nematocida parisii ERTm3]KAI5143355.1 ribulose-phosphate 3-epimerase [Nematocida parisii]EIJ94147.1 hypothetical protein NEPG_00814 [Nematocida parisii ERTm1]KAI5155389.1 ribulose-phosphate 3-epimerase [Nematocida parisii]KAI5156279.1 ribulose-phosphate 3-epimerase [Nematocida parisii]|eukprot:XP_013058643.1 hypothetical protein NEPG_00814 [Nematocida parisii ERTm1]